VTETGVAVAHSDKSDTYYAVQMFGRPKSAAIEFKIKNQTDDEIKYRVGDETFTLRASSNRTHEQCRSTEVKFQWAEAGGDSETVRPRHADSFVVTKEEGKFHVTKEQPSGSSSEPSSSGR
jgi:hypothetical protein